MKGKEFRTICFFLVCVLGISVAASTGTRQRLADYFAALNRYDSAASLTFYAADAVTIHGSEKAPFDRKIVKGYREFEATTHAHFTYRIHEISGDTADVFESESNDFYEVLGKKTHESHWAYRFRGSLIYEEVQLNTPSAEYLRAYRAFRAWIHQAKPKEAETVTMEDGNIIFDGRTASEVMSLAREWRAAPASPRIP